MQEKEQIIAPIKQRILQYVDFKKITRKDFCTAVGMSPSSLKPTALKSEIGGENASKVLNLYPDLSSEWLLTGKGEMLKNFTQKELSEEFATNVTNTPVYTGPTGNEYTEMESGKYRVSVPLVPAHAYARYLSDFQHDDLKERFEYVDFVVDMIGKGKYFAFEIKGDSMDDDSKRSIPDRSTVLARDVMQDYWKDKLHFKKFPYWIIVHQNSVLCKEIIDHDVERGIIKCHSINPSPEYTDFEIDLREVKQLLNIVKVQQDVNFY